MTTLSNKKLTASQRALVALRDMRQKLESVEQRHSETIAIIGMACRFPGAVETPLDYWDLLKHGKNAIIEIPGHRWDVEAYYDPDPAKVGKMYTKKGGFLTQIDQFDPEFFGLSHREAKSMDPQQRLLLEVSWEAVENAGISPLELTGTATGVFIGMSTNDYSKHHMNSNCADAIDIYSFTGAAPSIASGRISYFLGLQGPTMTIDTACSSSLVAVHWACRSLQKKEASMALVGGVNIMVTPENTIYFCKSGALSPDGLCKTFDEEANGYVRAEGCGILVLKRLSAAIADNNPILAVIRGTAVKHDGRSSGLTAPNGSSQKKLLEDALENAKASPEDIDYIEAHGTGTPLGDPIEVRALGSVFGKGRTVEEPLLIGSSKTNLGHLEAAAGMAGLMKVVLSLQHGAIPANLHFNKPNKHIDWDRLPIEVPVTLKQWKTNEKKRMAGVSAFGFSGTNAHVIVEEAGHVEDKRSSYPHSHHLLCFSAPTQSGLKQLAVVYKRQLENKDKQYKQNGLLEDFCYSSNISRSFFPHRSAVVSDSIQDTLQQLTTHLDSKNQTMSANTRRSKEIVLPSLIYIFDETDNGFLIEISSYLYKTEPEFTRHFDQCNQAFQSCFEQSPSRVDPEEKSTSLPTNAAKKTLLFTFQYAFYQLLKSWGIVPQQVMGKQIGEVVASCMSEKIQFREAIELVSLMGRNEPVDKNAFDKNGFKTVEKALSGLLENSNYVVLDFSHCDYEKKWSVQKDSIKTIWLTPFSAKSFAWKTLAEMLSALFQAGFRIDWRSFYHNRKVQFLSIPNTTYERTTCWIDRPPNARQKPGVPDFNDKQKERHGQCPLHPLLGQRFESPLFDGIFFHQQIDLDEIPFFQDHGFLDQLIIPAAAYIEMAVSASRQLYQTDQVVLEEVVYHEPFVLTKGEDQHIQFILRDSVSTSPKPTFEIVSPALDTRSPEQKKWMTHASGRINLENASCSFCSDIQAIQKNGSEQFDRATYYTRLKKQGYSFGKAHQGVSQIWKNGQTVLGKVELPSSLDSEISFYYFHPALLDACCHVLLSLLPNFESEDKECIFIVMGKSKCSFLRPPTKTLWVVATKLNQTESVFEGDIEIYNEHHEPVAKIERYFIKRISRVALNTSITKPNVNLDHLYQIKWLSKPRTLSDAPSTTTGGWIVFADNQGTGKTLIEELQNKGQTCIGVYNDRSSFKKPEHFLSLLADAIEELQDGNEQLSLQGIVYLWSLDDLFSKKGTIKNLELDQENSLGNLLHLVQAMVKQNINKLEKLVLVTRGSQAVFLEQDGMNLAQSSIWGMGGVISLEQSDWNCVRIDLDLMYSPEEATCLSNEILSHNQDDQVAFRYGKRVIPRLIKRSETGIDAKELLPIPRSENYRLASKKLGCFDHLYYQETSRYLQGSNEIEIEVLTAGISFYDVMLGLGLFNSTNKENGINQISFGLDCVGRVTAIGDKVKRLNVGDLVMAFGKGCFAKYVNVKANNIVKVPENLSIAASATIPTAYLTAMYGLYYIANLRNNQTVLIHSAAGGVGIAALCLAKAVGAKIIATSSVSKWDFLKKEMGIQIIFDSRKLDFAEEIKQVTNGEGVDVILNSATGERIAKNFSSLKTGGCFLEIGKQKLTDEELAHYRSDVTYTAYDLFSIEKNKPHVIQEMLLKIRGMLEEEKITPIPYEIFKAGDERTLFRKMQQGKNKGKYLLSYQFSNRFLSKKSSGTVLIIGGLGGLGFFVLKWLVSRRIKSIVLIGRRAFSKDVDGMISSLERKDTTIRYLQADVSNKEQLETVFKGFLKNGDSLKGVIHAAGIMDNGLLVQQNWSQFDKVLRSKVQGAWNLHELTKNINLNFFILFSSVTSLTGSIGVGSYAAANSFLDALAHFRQQQGLSALSINWGPWAEVGMLTKLDRKARDMWTAQGMRPISTPEGVNLLENLLEQRHPQLAAFQVDWSQWMKHYVKGKEPSILTHFISTEKKNNKYEYQPSQQERLAATGTLLTKPSKIGDVDQTVINLSTNQWKETIKQLIRKILQIETTSVIEETEPFQELGLDSLMSVELRNLLEKKLDKNLSATLLFNYTSVETLADYCSTLTPRQAEELEPTVFSKKENSEFLAQQELDESYMRRVREHNSLADIRMLLDQEIELVENM